MFVPFGGHGVGTDGGVVQSPAFGERFYKPKEVCIVVIYESNVYIPSERLFINRVYVIDQWFSFFGVKTGRGVTGCLTPWNASSAPEYPSKSQVSINILSEVIRGVPKPALGSVLVKETHFRSYIPAPSNRSPTCDF